MHRWKFLACAVALLFTVHGCASGRRVSLSPMTTPPCAAATLASAASGVTRTVTWVSPSAADGQNDRTRLTAWCESVGPAVVNPTRSADSGIDLSQHGLIVATWNIHEGGGDIERFVQYLRRQRFDSRVTPAIVVLLQEVAREDASVPDGYQSSVRVPGRIKPKRAPAFDIAGVANRLEMSLAYVPSMRNGRDREDRGSAIMSTLPLTDVVGIELPWVSQRRVAVMATVTALRNGDSWKARFVSVHLDNRPGRSIQAAALAGFAKTLPSGGGPLIIGGDLNTWFGPGEEAVRQLDAAVPRLTSCGEQGTFRFGLRLDHLFTTLESNALSRCEIVSDFFGSDHRPTVLHLFEPAWEHSAG